MNMDRAEIAVPRASGEVVFQPRPQKSLFWVRKGGPYGTGNFNCRWTGIMLDVHQRASLMVSHLF
jgi:hypothetical protein